MTSDRTDLRRQIVEVLASVFQLPAATVERGVSPDGTPGWDSEKHVELIVALEERFGCLFEPEDVPELTSLERMEEILVRHADASQR